MNKLSTIDENDDELFEDLKEIPTENYKVKIIYDKIRGLVWGCAIADAIGLPFEGCVVQSAHALSEKGITFPKSNNDQIRGIIKGDWTDDTDHMVLLMDSTYYDDQKILRVDNKLFASKLVTWRYNGFAELGDTSGMGIGSLTSKLTAHPKFTIEPQLVALETYKSLGGSPNAGKIDAPAPNGALMRIAPLAMSKEYLEEVLEHCIVTHYDGRCIYTCLMQCEIIRHIIKFNTITPNIIDHMHLIAMDILDKEFKNEVQIYYDIGMKTEIPDYTGQEFITTKIFEKLDVGVYDGSSNGHCVNKNGYTLVAYAIMLWGLRAILNKYSFATIIKTIIRAGGDADTNAAITGAVLGAYCGYSCLPADWINMTPHRIWLDKKINDFLDRV